MATVFNAAALVSFAICRVTPLVPHVDLTQKQAKALLTELGTYPERRRLLRNAMSDGRLDQHELAEYHDRVAAEDRRATSDGLLRTVQGLK